MKHPFLSTPNTLKSCLQILSDQNFLTYTTVSSFGWHFSKSPALFLHVLLASPKKPLSYSTCLPPAFWSFLGRE
jgi:hypothetical protein